MQIEKNSTYYYHYYRYKSRQRIGENTWYIPVTMKYRNENGEMIGVFYSDIQIERIPRLCICY